MKYSIRVLEERLSWWEADLETQINHFGDIPLLNDIRDRITDLKKAIQFLKAGNKN